MVTRRRALQLSLAMAGMGVALGNVAACGGGSRKKDRSTIVAGGSDVGIAALMIPALTRAAEENDASVDFRPTSQSTAQVAMLNGDIDMGFMSFINLASAAEQGKSVIGVAPSWASHTSLVVKEDAPYQKIADLRGKRIGTLKRTVSVYTETYAVLQDQGLDFEKDFELMVTDSVGILEGLLKKGEVDAITPYEPNVARMIHAGEVRELLQCAHYWGEQGKALAPAQNWAARREWAEEFGVARLKKIAARASQIASTDRELYSQAAKSLNLPDDEGLDLLFERFSQLVVEQYTADNLAQAQHELDAARGFDLVEKEHDVNDLVVTA